MGPLVLTRRDAAATAPTFSASASAEGRTLVYLRLHSHSAERLFDVAVLRQTHVTPDDLSVAIEDHGGWHPVDIAERAAARDEVGVAQRHRVVESQRVAKSDDERKIFRRLQDD